MIKKVFGILAIAGLLFSCGNQTQKEQAAQTDIEKVTVEQMLADMNSYVEKEIVIAGTVNHVCSHGGKRMFIIGKENPDAAIKITPNEEIGVFEKELEGSYVAVTGKLKELRINEAYVANLEKEIQEGLDNEAVHDHSGGTHDETESEADEKKAQIQAMRDRIAESENGYYSQFWIEASKFEVKECEHENKDSECEEDKEKESECEGDEHDHEHAEGEEHSH